MLQSLQATRTLPGTTAALWDGLVTGYPVTIIAEATSCLTDAGAAEADQILAAAAPGLTPGQLRAMAARVVMMIDPEAAERKKHAAKSARVEKYREDAGTAALCGRDLPPDAVLASWTHIDTAARALRANGAPGTLQQLRAAVYLGLTSGGNPLDLLARIITATGETPAPGGRSRPHKAAVPASSRYFSTRADFAACFLRSAAASGSIIITTRAAIARS